MMKSSCVVLLFALTSVSAVQRSLDSIDDLKEINVGQSVPTHTLLLLHWFANTVDIDGNVVRLTFDPNSDYGSHHYGNYEGMLERLPRGNQYRYYTVGNLNEETTSRQLPSYVTSPPRGYVDNRDRIVFRVRGQVIDQVYITQHQGQIYDPDQTYRITTNLLRQIREFSFGQNLQQLRNRFGSNADDSRLRLIRNTWGDLAVLGLLLFIVIEERSFRAANLQSYRHENYNRPENRQIPWDALINTILILFFICICIYMFVKGDPRYRY